MRTITVAGKDLKVDYWGNLANPSDWNDEIAKAMAKTDGIELTPDHWEVIHFLRAYYEEYQSTPNARMLPKAIAKKLGAGKGNLQYLWELFPYGPFKQGCKYAGLPSPTGRIC